MARARAASLWVVNRFPPSASAWSPEPVFYIDESERPVGVPVQGFADKKTAETARKQLERAARETTPIGPFLKAELPAGLGAIVAAAKAANLPLPDSAAIGPESTPHCEGNSVTYTSEYTDYRNRVEEAIAAWWAGVAAEITPEANALLWDKLFPKFQFYTLSRVLVKE
jgi:hypothetical protein